ncbi:MAG: hypothetical protein JSR93_05085 [Verrucomicrobia bacterium]|nr:hypothetical protein [Verrucomicrobiota bacterium]
MSFQPIHHAGVRAEPYSGAPHFYESDEVRGGIGEAETRMESLEGEVRPQDQTAAENAEGPQGFCAKIGAQLKVFADGIWSAIERLVNMVKSFFGKGDAANGSTTPDTPLEKFRIGLIFQFENRDQMVAAFYQLPVADRDAVKAAMWELTEEDGQPPRDWADRVIRGQVQLPGEAAPRQDIQEFSDRIGHEDGPLVEALEEVINAQAGISRLPENRFTMQDFQRLLGDTNLNRTLIFEAMRRLGNDPSRAIIMRMKDIALEDLRRENSSLRLNLQEDDQIREWAFRILFNVVRNRDETEDRRDILPFVDILAPNSVFRRAVQHVAANSVSNSEEQ